MSYVLATTEDKERWSHLSPRLSSKLNINLLNFYNIDVNLNESNMKKEDSEIAELKELVKENYF